jgi:hypothetical protein
MRTIDMQALKLIPFLPEGRPRRHLRQSVRLLEFELGSLQSSIDESIGEKDDRRRSVMRQLMQHRREQQQVQHHQSRDEDDQLQHVGDQRRDHEQQQQLRVLPTAAQREEDESSVAELDVGSRDYACSYCGALLWNKEWYLFLHRCFFGF